ncbi:TOMM precursor leader peptide-binding protein [Actinokineospora pegani]|uniref:TOMM precursor leader peptide-binding protein n=1 Tax=Actinokineospora pegani TaxID=2654637 RepID=UPI0012E9F701|nr:TOMM precursor leader peptide-binding protein [Actinokineospora pegani]
MRGQDRIGFRRHLRPEIVEGEAVYLFAENGVTALRGRAIELLAARLDGTRRVPELLRDLPAGVSAEQVDRMLDRLGAAGLIGPRPDPDPGQDAAALAYWDAAGLDPAAAAAAALAAEVTVLRVGSADAEGLAGALRRAGLATTATAGPTDPLSPRSTLSVVVCDDYLRPELRGVDLAHRAAGRPWLLVKPTGAQVWVGPVFTPGDGACWRCLATRLAANRPTEAHVQNRSGRTGPAARPDIGLAPVSGAAVEVAAAEAAKWLAGHRHPGQREVWVHDSLTMRATHHQVRALPQCPSCGDEDLVRARALLPVRLAPRPKRSRAGGGHRSRSPEEVLELHRHLVSPITGVVTDIRRDGRGHPLFQSFRSGTNIAAGDGFDALRSTLRDDNGGKGATALEAEVGALCEAVERHSGAFHGDEAVVVASYAELGERAVHPDAVQLFDKRQFADRDRANAAHSVLQWVPERFDEEAELPWTPVWSLTRGEHRLLPTASLYYGGPGPASVTANSNGCAAGCSVEDAVLQGLLELVERDAVALWWYNRTRAPGVDLGSLGDPFVDEVRRAYAELGREVWVLDLTADLDVPVFAALTRRVRGPREEVLLGFGAHLDPRCALRRALTELNQMMPAVSDLREHVLAAMDPDLRGWLTGPGTRANPHLLPDPSAPVRGIGDYADQTAADLLSDVETIQHRLEALGMEVLVLDQTRPDTGLPVVRVVVPGLRPFWSRLAPGRLYDVPVSLGRVDRPTAYDDMNPIPVFL